MTTLKTLKKNWEWLGQKDPLWAVCTDPRRSRGRWELRDFFAAGEAEVQAVLDYLHGLGVTPTRKEAVLDFGCGPGRLTRALSMRFEKCYGVDISSTMIETAKRLNKDRANCDFIVNDFDKLTRFSNNSFGFIYSGGVLQHIKPKYVVSYLREFARLLEHPGVLVFQMPSHRKAWMARLRESLQLGSKLRRLPEALRIAEADPRSRIEMNCLAEQAVRKVLSSTDCRLVDISLTNSCEPDFNGNLRYLDKEPDTGYVSKQYVVIKSA